MRRLADDEGDDVATPGGTELASPLDTVNPAAKRLQAGADGALVIERDPERRAQLVDAAVLAGRRGPCLRIANPLRAPLTLERILFQIAGDETTLSFDGNAALLSRSLAQRGDHVLLVINQAETLHLPVLYVLQQLMAAPRASVQLLLAGDARLLALLQHSPLAHKLARLREQLGVLDAEAPTPEALFPVAAEALVPVVPEAPVPVALEALFPAEQSEPSVFTPPASGGPVPDALAALPRPTPVEGSLMQPVMLGSEPPPRLGWGDERPDFLPKPVPSVEAFRPYDGYTEPDVPTAGERPTLEQIRAQYPLPPAPSIQRLRKKTWLWLPLMFFLLALAGGAVWALRTRPELQRLWNLAWPAQIGEVMLRSGIRLQEWSGAFLVELKQLIYRP